MVENEGSQIKILSLDVTDEGSIRTLSKKLDRHPLDCVIHSAGIYTDKGTSLENLDYQGWADSFAVNTMAPLRVSQALIPNLKLSTNPKIITISSQMGALSRLSKGSYAYRSSKAAVNKVMQLLALDLAKDGIIACPLHPGWVKTEMGGEAAEISPQESAEGLYTTIEKLTLQDSGKFFKWNGEPHAW